MKIKVLSIKNLNFISIILIFFSINLQKKQKQVTELPTVVREAVVQQGESWQAHSDSVEEKNRQNDKNSAKFTIFTQNFVPKSTLNRLCTRYDLYKS